MRKEAFKIKISDITAILTPEHKICIETSPINENQAFYTRDALYIGGISGIPDNLKSADVVNIMANDFMKLIIGIDRKGVS